MGQKETSKKRKKSYPGHCMNDELAFIDGLGRGELTDHQIYTQSLAPRLDLLNNYLDALYLREMPKNLDRGKLIEYVRISIRKEENYRQERLDNGKAEKKEVQSTGRKTGWKWQLGIT